jgi:hypothetical protein
MTSNARNLEMVNAQKDGELLNAYARKQELHFSWQVSSLHMVFRQYSIALT